METIASRKQDIKGDEEDKVKERPYAANSRDKSGNVRWNQTTPADCRGNQQAFDEFCARYNQLRALLSVPLKALSVVPLRALL
jgi:hypothetical protein